MTEEGEFAVVVDVIASGRRQARSWTVRRETPGEALGAARGVVARHLGVSRHSVVVEARTGDVILLRSRRVGGSDGDLVVDRVLVGLATWA